MARRIQKLHVYNSTVWREGKICLCMYVNIHILWPVLNKVLPIFNCILTFSKPSFENPETSFSHPLSAFSTILSAWPPVRKEVISTCSAAVQLSANRSR